MKQQNQIKKSQTSKNESVKSTHYQILYLNRIQCHKIALVQLKSDQFIQQIMHSIKDNQLYQIIIFIIGCSQSNQGLYNIANQNIRQSFQIRMQNSCAKSLDHLIFSQYEILIQLLIQNALFCKSENLRQRTIQMLEQLEKQDPAQLYSIDLSQFNDNPLTIEVSPLQSSFQLLLLQQFKSILENINKNFDDKIVVLKKYIPLIQSSYLPQYFQISKVRCKFTPWMKTYYFKHKIGGNLKRILMEKNNEATQKQLQKLNCCNAQKNQIKTWKLSQYEFLNQKELQQFIKGIQCELNKADQLLKKRKKHNIPESYPNHYEQLWNEERKKYNQKQKQILKLYTQFKKKNYQHLINTLFYQMNIPIAVFSNQQQQANQISQQQQWKVQTSFEVWKNAISSLPELKG
ncbi:unnamed protein product [Paramecium octaurelia]|uniref:Uncharacterized protein n=1 Tax=Paramecium octaurelia TaxID=43137 RepID=A0A8S1VCW4_PAROT|nr:unnamed protein product [Paramecium octaurelia]